jgi:hypothetical protein
MCGARTALFYHVQFKVSVTGDMVSSFYILNKHINTLHGYLSQILFNK